VEGQVPRPGIKRLAAALTRQKAVAVDDILGHLNTESLPGLTILPTPGHTPGHVVFLFDGVLFAGDLVMSRQNRLHPSPRILTWNSKRLKESIRLVGAHPFEWICPAHGKPLYGRKSWDDLMRSL
jgi:glyoxylase-like metal-dependent hydrolase (beta-lactamase superfamily II)